MPIEHAFVSAVADGADATLVQPSDWNDKHVSPFVVGTFTLATGQGSLQVDLMELTGSDVATLVGTSVLVIL